MRRFPTPTPAARRPALWLLLTGLSLLLLAGVGCATEGNQRPRPKAAFSIRGNLHVRLHPGTSAPVNLVLLNRRNFALRITRLKVRIRIDRRHARAGCSARRDFRVAQVRRRTYPIRLRARRSRSLTRLRVRRAHLPRVRMANHRRRNQNACKGAKLRLPYSGRARG